MKKSYALLGSLLVSSLVAANTPMTKESSFFVRPRVLIGIGQLAYTFGGTVNSSASKRNISVIFSAPSAADSAASLEPGALVKVTNCRKFQAPKDQEGYAEIRMADEKSCKAAAKLAGDCSSSKDVDGKEITTLKVPLEAAQCDALIQEGALKGKKIDFWSYMVSFRDNKLNVLPSLAEIQNALGENAAVAMSAPAIEKKLSDSQLEKKGRVSLTFKKPIKVERETLYARRSDKNPADNCYLTVGAAKIISVQPKINTTWKSGGCSERVAGANGESPQGKHVELRCGMMNPQGKKTDKAELHLVCNKPVTSEELPRFELKEMQTLLAPDLGVAFK